MCLFVPPNEKIRVADKDMTVYKNVQKFSNCWLPIYQTSQYFQYNTVLVAKNLQGCSIEHLHMRCRKRFYNIHEGFHSCILKKDYFSTEPNVICIIPKGSEYCLGLHDDIVSTNLIVFKTKLDYWFYKLFHKLI